MGKYYFFLTIFTVSLKGQYFWMLFTPTDFDLANQITNNSTIPHIYRNWVKTVEYKLNSPEALQIFE